eukprot:TRINITY_DN1668_c0_g1_i2.p2 TRINITY_DN1668_c0_g1~~TRINITY_DN1668_c0_g1_i2.p2  ORF type:complete len:112 (+),score=26.43 TRINITY_DN1668_c0_g1_i2:1179-1514(+)
MMIWGIAFVFVQVLLMKIVNVFLSWILKLLVTVPGGLASQTFIFIFIGLSMFLVPAIPGAPVYIAGGVLLVDGAWQEFAKNDQTYKKNEPAFGCSYLLDSNCLIIKIFGRI